MAQQTINYRKRIIEEINHSPKEIVKETLDFIKFLKSRTGEKEVRKQAAREIEFGAYNLGIIKGKLSREEIYGDYLTNKLKSE